MNAKEKYCIYVSPVSYDDLSLYINVYIKDFS